MTALVNNIGSAIYHIGLWKGVAVIDSPPELKGKKLLVLTGGADISPSIYNQKVGKTDAGELPSKRDKYEINLVRAAVQEGIPIVGICRGAQLLCALAGGSLWQDVKGHEHISHAILYKGEELMSNSVHHQMMIPPADAEVLATTKIVLSPQKWGEDRDTPVEDTSPEPEIVYFPGIKALGIQGHPEWMGQGSPFVKLTNQLIKEYLNVTVSPWV